MVTYSDCVETTDSTISTSGGASWQDDSNHSLTRVGNMSCRKLMRRSCSPLVVIVASMSWGSKVKISKSMLVMMDSGDKMRTAS